MSFAALIQQMIGATCRGAGDRVGEGVSTQGRRADRE
jgi:hypothetical protein